MTAIGHALPEDAQPMLELQRRAFAEEGRRSGSADIPPLTEPLDSISGHIECQTALVARDGGRIIGAIRGVVADRTCTIRALVVEPEFQGRGIGSSLLEALEAAHPDVERFDLTTNTVMEGNVPFYERHGYGVCQLTPYSEKVVLAQMTKFVTQGA